MTNTIEGDRIIDGNGKLIGRIENRKPDGSYVVRSPDTGKIYSRVTQEKDFMGHPIEVINNGDYEKISESYTTKDVLPGVDVKHMQSFNGNPDTKAYVYGVGNNTIIDEQTDSGIPKRTKIRKPNIPDSKSALQKLDTSISGSSSNECSSSSDYDYSRSSPTDNHLLGSTGKVYSNLLVPAVRRSTIDYILFPNGLLSNVLIGGFVLLAAGCLATSLFIEGKKALSKEHYLFNAPRSVELSIKPDQTNGPRYGMKFELGTHDYPCPFTFEVPGRLCFTNKIGEIDTITLTYKDAITLQKSLEGLLTKKMEEDGYFERHSRLFMPKRNKFLENMSEKYPKMIDEYLPTFFTTNNANNHSI